MSSTSCSTRRCSSGSPPRCKWLRGARLGGPPLGVQDARRLQRGPFPRGPGGCGLRVSRGSSPPQSEEEEHLPPVHAVHGARDGDALLGGEGEAEWGRLQLLLRRPALRGRGRDAHRPLVRAGSAGAETPAEAEATGFLGQGPEGRGRPSWGLMWGLRPCLCSSLPAGPGPGNVRSVPWTPFLLPVRGSGIALGIRPGLRKLSDERGPGGYRPWLAGPEWFWDKETKEGTVPNLSHQGPSASLSWLILVKTDFSLWAQADVANPAAGPRAGGVFRRPCPDC